MVDKYIIGILIFVLFLLAASIALFTWKLHKAEVNIENLETEIHTLNHFRELQHSTNNAVNESLREMSSKIGEVYLTIDEISRKVTNALNKLTMTSAKGENNNE